MSEIVTFAPTNASGGGNEFAIPFPYLSEAHVKLYVNGVEDTGKTFISDGAVKASVAITAGDIVVVKRQTPRDALITTLPTSGALSSDSMNEQSLQAVYVATEAADGLREGLALDVATETYWEGAPLGINRRIKNVVDPSAAQEAITKGWYDNILQTYVDDAAAAATAAGVAQAGAEADIAATITARDTAQAEAVLADAANAAAQAALGDLNGTPQGWADAAEDWAIEAEDTPVSVASGGDGSTTFSAYHWAQKSSDASLAATAAQTTAEGFLARVRPWASQDLLGDEEGFVVNWIGQNISVRDYGDASKMLINKAFLQAQRDGDIGVNTPAGNDVAQMTYRGLYGNHSGDGTSTQWWGPTHSEKTFQPIGKIYGGSRSYCAIPHEIGNAVYFAGTDTNVTRNASSTHNNPRLFYGRNTTRLQTTAATGFTRCNMNIGRSGNQYPADVPGKVVLIARQGTHSEAYIRYYDDVAATDYGCQIDLSDGSYAADGSHFANPFTAVRVIALPGGFYRYDCLFPAPTGALGIAGASYIQVGLRSGASYSWTASAAENIYIDYFNCMSGHGRGMLHINRVSIGSGVYRFDVKGPAGSLDGAFPTLGHLGYCTWWTHRYFTEAWQADSGDDKLLTGWSDASTGAFYAYRDYTDGNLKVYIEDATGANETWDTGVNLALDDTDNGGYGTKLGLVVSLNEADGEAKCYYRINDGTINELTRTLTTATGTFSTIDGSTTYCGTDSTGNTIAGFMYVYDGYYTRPADLATASRYLRLHAHNDAW